MLRFITKQEYWSIEDSGILSQLPDKFMWHLKSIQDAVAFNYLHEHKNHKIAEIGGGNSRILPVISKDNECANIEEFKGVGGGPKKEVIVDNVKNILVSVGEFSELIANDYFDIIFSVSVVEHVLNEKLDDFFKDCHRILKPGGQMIHLIDMYLEDSPRGNIGCLEKITHYREVFTKNLFRSPEPEKIISNDEVKFSATFATNPDNMMNQWNRSAPSLREKRERSQSCSLVMVAIK